MRLRWRLAAVALITLVALVGEAALSSGAGHTGFLMAVFALVVNSWYFGRAAGVISTAISIVAYTGPVASVLGPAGVTDPRSAVNLLVFGLVGVLAALAVGEGAHLTAELQARVQDRKLELFEANLQLSEEVRRRAMVEAALRQSEVHYRDIVETSYEGIMKISPEGTIVFANRRLAELLRTDPATLLGKCVQDYLPPDQSALLDSRLDRRREGIHEHYESRFRRADGDDVWVAVSASPVLSPAGEFLGALAMVTDITERKKTEAALREAEARFAAFMENIPAVAVIRSEEGTYVTASRSYEQSFGKAPEELVGKTPFDVFPPDVAQQLLEHEQEVFRDGRTRQFTQFVPGKDGRTRELLTDKFLLVDEAGRRYVGSIAVDVTAQRALEDQLRQSQKMEAVGRLAGGVAHDFNNMLAVIMGYSEVLGWRSDLPEDARTLVREVHTAGQRAATLTRQLLAFGRQQILAPRILDLGETVTASSNMLRRLIGEDIELVVVLDQEPSRVKADPSQVEQIVLNLVVNSRDALPTGGQITVEVQNIEVDEVYAAQHADVTPGSYVLLAVTDNGDGMDAATQERVFEPFFTTKAQGKGTGLGLATVFGIVKQSNGNVAVYSEIDNGTTFKVYLPRVTELESAKAPAMATPLIPRGAETILLVEDEGIVRCLARDILIQAGYTVLEAAGGHEALRLIREHGAPVDLVVADVVMPHMSGRELVQQLTVEQPGIRVLLMSGYTDDAVVRHGILSAETEFLQKPFTASGFAQRVREVLNRR